MVVCYNAFINNNNNINNGNNGTTEALPSGINNSTLSASVHIVPEWLPAGNLVQLPGLVGYSVSL